MGKNGVSKKIMIYVLSTLIILPTKVSAVDPQQHTSQGGRDIFSEHTKEEVDKEISNARSLGCDDLKAQKYAREYFERKKEGFDEDKAREYTYFCSLLELPKGRTAVYYNIYLKEFAKENHQNKARAYAISKIKGYSEEQTKQCVEIYCRRVEAGKKAQQVLKQIEIILEKESSLEEVISFLEKCDQVMAEKSFDIIQEMYRFKVLNKIKSLKEAEIFIDKYNEVKKTMNKETEEYFKYYVGERFDGDQKIFIYTLKLFNRMSLEEAKEYFKNYAEARSNDEGTGEGMSHMEAKIYAYRLLEMKREEEGVEKKEAKEYAKRYSSMYEQNLIICSEEFFLDQSQYNIRLEMKSQYYDRYKEMSRRSSEKKAAHILTYLCLALSYNNYYPCLDFETLYNNKHLYVDKYLSFISKGASEQTAKRCFKKYFQMKMDCDISESIREVTVQVYFHVLNKWDNMGNRECERNLDNLDSEVKKYLSMFDRKMNKWQKESKALNYVLRRVKGYDKYSAMAYVNVYKRVIKLKGLEVTARQLALWISKEWIDIDDYEWNIYIDKHRKLLTEQNSPLKAKGYLWACLIGCTEENIDRYTNTYLKRRQRGDNHCRANRHAILELTNCFPSDCIGKYLDTCYENCWGWGLISKEIMKLKEFSQDDIDRYACENTKLFEFLREEVQGFSDDIIGKTVYLIRKLFEFTISEENSNWEKQELIEFYGTLILAGCPSKKLVEYINTYDEKTKELNESNAHMYTIIKLKKGCTSEEAENFTMKYQDVYQLLYSAQDSNLTTIERKVKTLNTLFKLPIENPSNENRSYIYALFIIADYTIECLDKYVDTYDQKKNDTSSNSEAQVYTMAIVKGCSDKQAQSYVNRYQGLYEFLCNKRKRLGDDDFNAEVYALKELITKLPMIKEIGKHDAESIYAFLILSGCPSYDLDKYVEKYCQKKEEGESDFKSHMYAIMKLRRFPDKRVEMYAEEYTNMFQYLFSEGMKICNNSIEAKAFAIEKLINLKLKESENTLNVMIENYKEQLGIDEYLQKKGERYVGPKARMYSIMKLRGYSDKDAEEYVERYKKIYDYIYTEKMSQNFDWDTATDYVCNKFKNLPIEDIFYSNSDYDIIYASLILEEFPMETLKEYVDTYQKGVQEDEDEFSAHMDAMMRVKGYSLEKAQECAEKYKDVYKTEFNERIKTDDNACLYAIQKLNLEIPNL